MKSVRVTKVSALIASAAAATQADTAGAQPPAPVWTPATTVTFEGGVSFANFVNSGGAIPFIPQDLDKTGLTPQGSGDLSPGHRTGGYGAFSVARNIDAVNDWRFSAGFNVFGAVDRFASASQGFVGDFGFSATNSAAIKERDRFGFYTADFDFGRNWSQGMVKVRAFAGVRALYTDDRLDAQLHTEGTDKLGFLTPATLVTDSSLVGRSSFFGLGPRVGVDVFAGSTFGIVGSFSAALMAGSRNASVSTSSVFTLDGGSPTSGTTFVRNNENSYVGNLSAMVGAAWQFSPTGQLVVGYKLDQWYNIRQSFAFAGFDRKEDLLVQTPFIRATLRF